METYEMIELIIGFVELGGFPVLIWFYRKYTRLQNDNRELKQDLLKYQIKEELRSES